MIVRCSKNEKWLIFINNSNHVWKTESFVLKSFYANNVSFRNNKINCYVLKWHIYMSSSQSISSSKKVVSTNAKNVMFLRQKMISFYQDCQNRSSCDLFQVVALTCKFKRKRQNTILASGKNFFSRTRYAL